MSREFTGMSRRGMALAVALAGVVVTAGCAGPVLEGGKTSSAPVSTDAAGANATATEVPGASPTGSSSPAASTPGPSTTPSSVPPAAKPKPKMLKPGAKGKAVKALQTRLLELGFWLPEADGQYGFVTQQAVYAFQKANDLERDGVVGSKTAKAMESAVRPQAHVTGDAIEIDKKRQLLLVVRDSQVVWAFNTSTGSGQTYFSRGSWRVAGTPSGTFKVFRSVDGPDKAPLGVLYRPRYFNGGIAVHGLDSVPPYPASHGCARVSDPAMDFIWKKDYMPKGSTVVVR